MARLAMAVVVGALFTACNGGPSDLEFVAACMNEGQGVASQMLDAELGVTRDAFCKCGAGIAIVAIVGRIPGDDSRHARQARGSQYMTSKMSDPSSRPR